MRDFQLPRRSSKYSKRDETISGVYYAPISSFVVREIISSLPNEQNNLWEIIRNAGKVQYSHGDRDATLTIQMKWGKACTVKNGVVVRINLFNGS